MTIQNAKIVGTQVMPEYYHQYNPDGDGRGEINYVMSRSDLMEFNHCPHRWAMGYHKSKTEALSYGNMLDAFVLDRDRFDEAFIVRPDTYENDKGEIKKWNNNSNTCKKWNAETLKSGMGIISEADLKICKDAENSLLADEVIKGILDTSDFQVMITAEWHDKPTGLKIPLKCLIDIVPRKDSYFHRYLADLKTCRTACVGQWAREVYNWGYHVQGAFYLDMHEAATGEVRNGFAHILQESYEPYEVGRRLIDEDFIELGRDKYFAALEKYCECMKSGKFGGYDDYSMVQFDGFTSVGPESWMIDK